jgi:hypothetical protein
MNLLKSLHLPIVTLFCLFPFSIHANLSTNIILFPTADGGASGGGGFFIQTQPETNPTPITHPEIIVNKAYGYILSIAEAAERGTRFKDAPPALAHFMANSQLGEILEEVKPLGHTSGPCLNKYHEEVDGSIYSFAPNTVCVSTYNLAEKVATHDQFPQTAGILIHEYAEVMGHTEVEAIQLQTLMIEYLRQISSSPK